MRQTNWHLQTRQILLRVRAIFHAAPITADRECSETKLCRDDGRSAGGPGYGQGDFVDKRCATSRWDIGDQPAETIEGIKTDGNLVVAHGTLPGDSSQLS